MANIRLSNIPKEVLQIINSEQQRIKKEKEIIVYSKEMTVYSIIKSYAKKCLDQK